jgi:hypothetical protein
MKNVWLQIHQCCVIEKIFFETENEQMHMNFLSYLYQDHHLIEVVIGQFNRMMRIQFFKERESNAVQISVFRSHQISFFLSIYKSDEKLKQFQVNIHLKLIQNEIESIKKEKFGISMFNYKRKISKMIVK